MPIRIIATGDSFIVRPLATDDPRANKIRALCDAADARFTNLETVVRRDEGFPAAQSGGTWASSPPEVLDSLRDLGFNCLAWANNHTLDYSHGGLAATRKYLEAGNWVHAGAGLDLPEAAAPKYLGTPNGTVALVAATSSFHESWSAGMPRPGIGGRPGVNPLRASRLHAVAPERLEVLRRIADECRINAAFELRLEEGFASPDPPGRLRLGSQMFVAAGNGCHGEITTANNRDAARLYASIETAAKQADCVLASIHAHDGKNADKTRPADFLIEVARGCIDAGAHAVIGHGPHVLRGMQIHRERPIFYSLGNFIFQNELVEHLPADFYESYGLDYTLSTREALDRRSKNGTIGLGVNPSAWHAVVADFTFADGRLKSLLLHPVGLGFQAPVEQRGIPELGAGQEALEEIRRLSAEFGVNLEIRDGLAQL